jgi:hypothetical protein
VIDKIESPDLKGDDKILSKKILDIFKKLNNGDVEIKIDWGNEKIDRDIFDKIRENMENIGEKNFFNAVNLYLEENPDFYSSKVNRKLNDIMREIQKDYVSIDNGIEEMIISDKINEVILNYYTVDYNIEELLENTKLEEIKIEINSKDKENLSLERYGDMGVYSFANDARITYKAFDNITNDVLYKNLVKDFTNFLGNDNNNKFDSLHYLLQTQGYELNDLYNKDEIKNSKFLSSLKNEMAGYLNDLPDMERNSLFLVIKDEETSNLLTYANLTLENTDLKIEKFENVYLGFGQSYEVENGNFERATYFDKIKLEKGFTIPNEYIGKKSNVTFEKEVLDEKEFEFGIGIRKNEEKTISYSLDSQEKVFEKKISNREIDRTICAIRWFELNMKNEEKKEKENNCEKE